MSESGKPGSTNDAQHISDGNMKRVDDHRRAEIEEEKQESNNGNSDNLEELEDDDQKYMELEQMSSTTEAPFIDEPHTFSVRETWYFDLEEGEEGGNKEFFSQRIHSNKSRIYGKHIILNCKFDEVRGDIMDKEYGGAWKEYIERNGEDLTFEHDAFKGSVIMTLTQSGNCVLWEVIDVNIDDNFKLNIKRGIIQENVDESPQIEVVDDIEAIYNPEEICLITLNDVYAKKSLSVSSTGKVSMTGSADSDVFISEPCGHNNGVNLKSTKTNKYLSHASGTLNVNAEIPGDDELFHLMYRFNVFFLELNGGGYLSKFVAESEMCKQLDNFKFTVQVKHRSMDISLSESTTGLFEYLAAEGHQYINNDGIIVLLNHSFLPKKILLKENVNLNGNEKKEIYAFLIRNRNQK